LAACAGFLFVLTHSSIGNQPVEIRGFVFRKIRSFTVGGCVTIFTFFKMNDAVLLYNS
jgi:hypothetical protein